MKIFFLSMLLGLLSFSSANAQGQYLNSGQNGFGIRAGVSGNKDATAISSTAGFCLNGLVDFSAGVARVAFDEQLMGTDVSAVAVNPGVSFYALKQNSVTPVSLSFDASYEFDIFSSDALDAYNLELTGSSFSVGASLFSLVPVSPNSKIKPLLGLDYVSSTSEVKDKYGNKVSDDETATVVTVGLGIVFQTTPFNTAYVSPHAAFSKNTTSYGISVGMVFASN